MRWIFILLLNVHQIIAKLEIFNLNDNPVSVMELGSCRIKTGDTTIVHPINLTNIGYIVEEFKGLANHLYMSVNDEAQTRLLLHAVQRLSENFDILKPLKEKRPKRWDALGTGWKMIAGTPDAKDLKILNSTMNELIEQNNVQIVINNKINKQLKEIVTVSKASISKNEKIIEALDIFTIITNINALNLELEQIHKIVANTKLGIVNPQFLSSEEILSIKDLLVDQGIELNFPEEALNFVSPKLAIKRNELMYLISVPNLAETKFNILRIQPLINQGEIIITTVKYVIFNGNELYETKNNVDYIQYLENLRDLSTDKCIKPILVGGHSQCNFTTISDQPKTIMLSSSSVLINNVQVNVHSNCMPQNRSLNGNYLISFHNCTVWINNEQFKAQEILIKHKPVFGAWQNLNVTKEILLHKPNVSAIELGHIETRKIIDHVYLQQYHMKITMYSLFGGFSLIVIVSTLVLILCKNSLKFH